MLGVLRDYQTQRRIANRSVASGLGLVCVEGDCDAGRALVGEMRQTFQSLSALGQIDPTQYQARVDAIASQFDALDSAFSTRWIPFSSNCCTIRDLGVQAQGLTKEMLGAAGQQPLAPAIDTSGLDLNPLNLVKPITDPLTNAGQNIGITIAIVAGVVAIAWAGFSSRGHAPAAAL